MRILNFADGFTSTEEPSKGTIASNNFLQFDSDASFVDYKTSPASQGDAYFNTTSDIVRVFNGANWVDVVSTDSSGDVALQNVLIAGNLTVQGTTVTLNTQTLDVEDLNITVNKGGNDTTAEGAGLTVDRTGTDGSLVYDSTKASKWKAGNAGSESELVTVSDTQTLTNKTLTSPVISSPTGINKSDVGLSNVDNTSDATKNSAVATLSNKTLTAPVITSPTGLVKADVGLGNVDNTSDATKNSAVSTLTNKTIGDAPTFTQVATPSTPAAGFNKIYPKSDGSWYTLNSSGIETQVGSGSSGGVRNYLQYNDFENNATTGWSLFGTTLTGVIPTGTINAADGTLSTFNITSINPISGSRSLRSDSGGPITAGQGFISDAFTIDNADKAKVLTYKFYYDAVSNSGQNFSGTSANTFAVYIYDVTNSAWIQPAGVYGMTQGSGVGYTTGTFQTTSNSTQYRLAVIYINGTSAGSTYTFDRFYLGPQTAPIGAVVTDWQSYVPTLTGFGIPTSVTFEWMRLGDSILVRGRFTSGTPSATTASFTLPSGIIVDTNKLQSITKVVGSAQRNGTDSIYSILATGGQNTVNFGAGAGRLSAQNGNDIISASQSAAFETDPIPVTGWSSNVQMSNDTDTRVVDFVGDKGSTQSVTANTTDITVTSVKDSHGAWNGSQYVVPVSGDYIITSAFIDNAGASVVGFNAYVNSVSTRRIGQSPATTLGSGATILTGLKAGDTISVRSTATVTLAAAGSIGITRISGPATIASSEEVSCRYTNTAGTAYGAGAEADLPFATRDYDSHAAFSGATFTAPISGRYRVSAGVLTANFTLATNQAATVKLNKNGSFYTRLNAVIGSGVANTVYVTGSDTVNLLAGETITFRFACDAAASLNTGAGNCHMSIERIK